MGTYDNIKDRIMRKPTANDITDKEIKRFLEGFGFELARSKGSHFIYKYKNSELTLVLNIPMHSPIKPAYIDQIREAVLRVEGEN